jgi:carboxyl-terminal processing protease
VGLQVNAEAFFEENGGSFGLVLTELTDGRVLVTQVIPDTPGSKAGIQRGAEILEWDGKPVSQAIDEVIPYLGPSSTQHYRRLEQAIFLTRVPVDSTIDVRFRNPEDTVDQEIVLKSEIEYNSLFTAIPQLSQDPLLPPVEGQILDDSGLGYIRVNTFSADYSLIARLWDHFIKGLIDNQVRGLIIDLRANPGGASDLALSFTGYFFADEIPLFQNRYYSDLTQTFEASGPLITLKPGPVLYDGLVAVLISPYCVSACEGFAYALSQQDRSIIVGHFPTAGAFGEVGRGQYLLPGDVAVQFPTGRHETLDGNVLLEGAGLPLDISVPVTEESVLGVQDAVLDAAIEALLKQ